MIDREQWARRAPVTVPKQRSILIVLTTIGIGCGFGAWAFGIRQTPVTTTMNSSGYYQVPVAPKTPTAVPADTASTAEPDAEHKAMLMKDIEHALALLKDDHIEQFIEDYYPIDVMKKLRHLNRVSNAANDLRRVKSVLRSYQVRFVKCQTARPEGNNHEVVFKPVAGAEVAQLEVEIPPKQGVNVEATVKGYGGDLKQALQLALADLKAKKYEVFLEQMLPANEASRLLESGQLAETARLFQTHPTLGPAMIADLEALTLTPLKNEGALFLATFAGLAPNGTPREVRFQRIGGSWRFYDQTTAAQAEIDRLSLRAEQKQSDPSAFEPILKFERIRDHWRLVELP